MRLFHAPAKTRAIFDDGPVIAYGGLASAMRLAERCDLGELVGEHVTLVSPEGVNASAKVASIVARMMCGADSIDGLDARRHGGMDKIFDGIRAPSTLGSFLHASTWGNVRQLDKNARLLLVRLAGHTPLLPGADVLTSPYALMQAEEQHRDHTMMEQVNVDLIDDPLAQLPSGMFTANAAWLTYAAIMHNLLRAFGCLVGAFHAHARGATLRRHLIIVPARLARHGCGHLVLHLPQHWRWQQARLNAFDAVHHSPPIHPA